MFKNREYVGHVVGSAAIGVAVGMLVHKILSPRSSQQPSSIAASPIRYEYVQEYSQANSLQLPSKAIKCNKHQKHRDHLRSKSASRPKQLEKECGYLSASSPLMKRSKLRASETDLRSNLQTDNDESIWRHYEKMKPRKKPMNMARNSDNESADTDSFILNSFTEFTPLKLKDSTNSTIEKDYNLESFGKFSASKSTEDIPFKLKDQKDLFTTAKDYNMNPNYESFASKSTEYLPLKLKNQKDLCDTTKENNLNSVCESFANKSTEYLPLKLKDQKNLCDITKDNKLNSYPESFASKSTEYLPLKLKDQKDLSTTAKDYNVNPNCELFASKSTEYLPLMIKNQKDLCTTAEDYNLNSYCKSFANKTTEYFPLKLKDQKDLSTMVKDYNLNPNYEYFASKSTEDLPLKLKDEKDLCDTTKDYKLISYRETFASKSTEDLPSKLKDEKDLCDTTEDYKSNYHLESFTSRLTEYHPFKLKDQKDLCDTAKDYKLNFDHETFANVSKGYPAIEIENISKFYEPLSLLFDVNNRKLMTKNNDFIFLTSNREGDEISNQTTMTKCDTVEKDYNFNLNYKKRAKIMTELKELDVDEFVTLPTFFGSKVFASIIGNETLQP